MYTVQTILIVGAGVAKKRHSFGEKLYSIRVSYRDKFGVSRKVSIREAARMVTDAGYKISHGGYARWEQPDGAIPSRNAIQAICKAFDCRPSALFEEFYGGSSADNSRARAFADVDLLDDDNYKLLLDMKDALIAATIAREHASNKNNDNEGNGEQ